MKRGVRMFFLWIRRYILWAWTKKGRSQVCLQSVFLWSNYSDMLVIFRSIKGSTIVATLYAAHELWHFFLVEAWLLFGDSARQFSNMLSCFLNLNALPVPLLRQVYLDPSGLRFSHVFIDMFTKVTKKRFLDWRFLMCLLTFSCLGSVLASVLEGFNF